MKALYVGSCTVDVNALCSSIKPASMMHRKHTEKYILLSFASKTILDDVSVTTGGSAANSAVASKILGTPVDLVSAVGDDFFGSLVVADLKEHGVPTSHVWRIRGAKTSVGINILAANGEKTNLVYKGATDLLGEKHLELRTIKSADAVVCTSLASKKNWGLFTKTIKTAKASGKKTVFAPSITMLRARKQELAEMRDHFDVAVLNHEEAGFLTHTHNPLAALHLLPGKINVVTHDVRGTYVEENGNVWHVPTLNVKVADTTGAGDSFTGALVHGLLHHEDALEAVKLATAVACWNIMMPGAKVEGSKERIMAFKKKNEKNLKLKQIS